MLRLSLLGGTIIFKYKSYTEFYTDEHCHIKKFFNRNEDADYSVTRAGMEPSFTMQLHASKDTAERYVTLEGKEALKLMVGIQPLACGDESQA